MIPDPDISPLRPPLHFDARLSPHRALGHRGFLVVMALVISVSFAAGLMFTLMGAWPVFGFFGLDVALIYFAFRHNYRSARAYETVQLSDGMLKIRKVAADGTTMAWRFEPYWARVHFDRQAEEEVKVAIISHGQQVIVGDFLAPEERIQFGDALRGELARFRATPLVQDTE